MLVPVVYCAVVTAEMKRFCGAITFYLVIPHHAVADLMVVKLLPLNLEHDLECSPSSLLKEAKYSAGVIVAMRSSLINIA